MLFPGLPYVGLIAYRRIPAVPHDGRFEKQGVFENLVFDIVGQVLQVLPVVRLALAVDKFFNAHCGLEAVQFSPAQTLLRDINKLEGNPPFFEVSLRFLRLPAFESAENLYVQGTPLTP